MHWKIISAIVGFMLICCAFIMQIPAWVDIYFHAYETGKVFLWVSSITVLIGVFFFLMGRYSEDILRPKDMFLSTTLLWTSFIFFAALPFYFSPLGLSFTDALFESTSGLTTTGATILSNLDTLSKGVLLWRSLLQWLGAIGVVVVAVMVLPVLQVGGMSFFTTESSENSDKNTPKAGRNMLSIVGGFSMLTLLCFVSLYFGGMSVFDALNHAMTCVANAGFSTHDASIGYYNSATLEWILIVFMILSSLPLLVPFYLFRGYWHKIFENEQIKTFFIFLITSFILLTSIRYLQLRNTETLHHIVRTTLFTLVSLMTTTGFVIEDYTLWGTGALACLFFLMLAGGCTGSASGGIKMFRFTVLGRVLLTHFKRLLQPYGIFIPRYGKKPITSEVLLSIYVFLTFFFLTCIGSTILLSFSGLDLTTSLASSFSAVANVGPSFGDDITPEQTYVKFPLFAKWILMSAMLLGRLEFTSVVILCLPFMWRKMA